MNEDLSDVIDALASGTYTVRRFGSPNYVSGRASPGPTTTFIVRALVQPVAGDEVQTLPQNLRSTEVQAVFTATRLRTGGAGIQPDVIEIAGEDWAVQDVQDWSTIGGYIRALVARAR